MATVKPDQLALCTLAQIKNRNQMEDIGNDDQIKPLIPLVLERFNEAFGREFMWTGADEERVFEVPSRVLRLPFADLRPGDNLTVVLHPELEHQVLTRGVDYVAKLDPLTKTAGVIEISRRVSMISQFSAAFGYAQISITGDWGIWEQLSDVPKVVNEAAIETVLAWVDRPVTDVAGIDSSAPRASAPGPGQGLDIPRSAYIALGPYNRHKIQVY